MHGELLTFTCPRCAGAVTSRFYGPCEDCRTWLRANLGLAQSDLVVEDYVPKMNVTPNQIATKD